MFRIEKHLVQEGIPAEIPLIPMAPPEKKPAPPPDSAPKAAPKAEAPPPPPREERRKDQQQAQKAMDDLLKQAQQTAEAQLKTAQEEAAAATAAAQTEATAQLEAAQAEARRLLTEAKARGLAQGQEEGLAAGRKQGLEEYQQQMQEAAQQLSRLLVEIEQGREEYFASFEGEMVDLALAIAQKIVHHTIEQDQEAFTAIISHTLKQMRREGRITVRISEQQYQDFFQASSATFVLGDENIRVSLVEDPLLVSGDLIVETEGETVNAGADSQLKYLALAFGRPAGEA